MVIRNLLQEAGIDRLDAEVLLAHVLGVPREKLLFLYNEPAAPPAAAAFSVLCEKRRAGCPIAYLVGEKEFYSLSFLVTPTTLIPRPDTETLVERVIDFCRRNNIKSPKIADLCSGSGCIAITLKKEIPEAEIIAVELSDKALPYLRENAQLNKTDIHIIQGDVLDGNIAKIKGYPTIGIAFFIIKC